MRPEEAAHNALNHLPSTGNNLCRAMSSHDSYAEHVCACVLVCVRRGGGGGVYITKFKFPPFRIFEVIFTNVEM